MNFCKKKIIKIVNKELLFEFNSDIKSIKYNVKLNDNIIGELFLSPKIDFNYNANEIKYIDDIDDIIYEFEEDLNGILFYLLEFKYFLVFDMNINDEVSNFLISYDYNMKGMIHLISNIYISIGQLFENTNTYVIMSHDIISDILKLPILNKGKNFEVVCNYLNKIYGEKYIKRLKELNLENLI